MYAMNYVHGIAIVNGRTLDAQSARDHVWSEFANNLREHVAEGGDPFDALDDILYTGPLCRCRDYRNLTTWYFTVGFLLDELNVPREMVEAVRMAAHNLARNAGYNQLARFKCWRESQMNERG